MWFFLGFISFIAFASFHVYRRLYVRWAGTSRTFRGVEYQYATETRKDKTTGFKVGIEIAGGYDFLLKRENWADRFFKKNRFDQGTPSRA